jgi:hypothetical protein
VIVAYLSRVVCYPREVGRDHSPLIEKGKNMCEEYQGWSNRETWCANLWIENEQGLSEIVADYARQEIEDRGEDANAYELGEVIRDFIENQVLTYSEVRGDEQVFTMLTDIGSLYRVKWDEMAKYYIEVVRENTAMAELMGGEVV